jgi:hypothetical protein
MKPLVSKMLASAALALIAWLVLAGASAPKSSATLNPGKLVILSTTDVKGKTSPCG